MNYGAYIGSWGWAFRSWAERTRSGWCCEFCGNIDTTLHVHHISYERLGNERPEDLIVLCWGCHADAHEYPKRMAEIAMFAAHRTPTTTMQTSE